MDDLSKEYVISYFNKSLAFHGDRPEAVKWSANGQMRRFEALLEIAPSIRGSKILDFGCGKGDFYAFLKMREISVDFIGLDINNRLIELARRKFPECRFDTFDIERDLLSEDFDYVFLCGVFNLKVEGIQELIEETLRKLFKHCRIALAINALSACCPKKDVELHYVYPAEISRFAAKELSPYISLRQDTVNHDFIMFVYRDISSLPDN